MKSVTGSTRSDVWSYVCTSPKSHTCIHSLEKLAINFRPRRGYALLMELLQHSSTGAHSQVDVNLHTQVKIPKVKVPKVSKMKISKVEVPSVKDTKGRGTKCKDTKY